MGKTHGIVHGIRVIEAASMVIVPAVGAVLAEYGAGCSDFLGHF